MRQIGFALAGVLMPGAFLLGACSEEQEAAPAPVDGVVPGMTVENGRVVLAPVSGNPAAVYFDLAYDGERALSLYDAEVAGTGEAMIHQTVVEPGQNRMVESVPIPLRPGDSIEFKPGDYHVMAMDVSPELEAGGTTEVTLKLSGGGTHKFDAEVRAAGDER